ncbi:MULTISPECIES: hypothetical protein [unclassified Providencia]|uniref:hypothetical protein n=1 Tax=unclassified Providencia TaxID=2633465 RepID=UPI00234B2671|nr:MULTISPECIES: hypothetical protein [unclassified Providencia]
MNASHINLKDQHVWDGPQVQDFLLPDLPQSICKECLQKAHQNTVGVMTRE